MRFKSLSVIRYLPERVVVINVETEVVTALAVASALTHGDLPVLLVNCTPNRASDALLGTLMESWGFDIVDLPLRPHGVTLDLLFQGVPSDRLLLLDSDAELTSSTTVTRMRAAFDDVNVFGSGFVQSGEWLPPAAGSGDRYYRERPWIPCAMFRVAQVRQALMTGKSFAEYFTRQPEEIETWGLSGDELTQGFREGGHSDTGGEMYNWCKSFGYRFDGPSIHSDYADVRHYHGVTRLRSAPADYVLGNGMPLAAVEQDALERLAKQYAPLFPRFAQAVRACQTALADA